LKGESYGLAGEFQDFLDFFLHEYEQCPLMTTSCVQ